MKKQLLLGTTNQAKVDHLRELFEPLPIEILSAKDLGIDIDVREDGRSPEENAAIKARAYFARSNIPTLATDAGLYIEGFPDKKQPGVFVRRIHGLDRTVTDQEALDYYVRELGKVGGESTGIWRVAIVLVISPGKAFSQSTSLETRLTSRASDIRIPGAPLSSLTLDPAIGKVLLGDALQRTAWLQVDPGVYAAASRRVVKSHIRRRMMQRLKDKVAVVTGASRGGGRGIALVLGEEGATVYVTGRSVKGASTREDLPHTTVQDTAEQVTARGGVGIPVRCDHAVDTDVEWLFERVKRKHGRLDILVNNAWGGYENYISDESFDAPFWEQPIARFDRMWLAGVRSHMVTTRFALPLMMPNQQGLIVNTTYDTGSRNWDLDRFGSYSVFYDTAKTAINRMTLGMARDLRPHNIAVVALWPGWMNTETMNPTTEDLEIMESVEYIGRAVAALAADPDVMTKTGQLLHTRALGQEYGFTDVDGRELSPWPPDR